MTKRTAKCPECKGNLKTIETKPPPKYQALVIVQRRRQCQNCKEKFTTYEVKREEWQWILDLQKRLDERQEALAWQHEECNLLHAIRLILREPK